MFKMKRFAWIAAVGLVAGTLGTVNAEVGSTPLEPQTSIQAAPSAEQAAQAEHGVSIPFDAQIDQWIQTLSGETGFDSWRESTWRKYPLGPGQHGWVIILQGNDGEEVGYLIALNRPDGTLVLGEYGLGEMPLFSQRTLKWALESEGLEGAKFTDQAVIERIYADAVHSYWKVSENGVTRYADAKFGAWLPIDEADVKLSGNFNLMQHSDRSGEGKPFHIINDPIDPYDDLSWMDAPYVFIDGWGSLLDRIFEGLGMVYSAEAFNGKAYTPLSVSGIHWWKLGERMMHFVALEQEGLRYIPLETLLQNGTFHSFSF